MFGESYVSEFTTDSYSYNQRNHLINQTGVSVYSSARNNVTFLNIYQHNSIGDISISGYDSLLQINGPRISEQSDRYAKIIIDGERILFELVLNDVTSRYDITEDFISDLEQYGNTQNRGGFVPLITYEPAGEPTIKIIPDSLSLTISQDISKNAHISGYVLIKGK